LTGTATPAGNETTSSTADRKSAVRVIICFGIVSFFADMTYEGAHSILGPFLEGTERVGVPGWIRRWTWGDACRVAAFLQWTLGRSNARVLDRRLHWLRHESHRRSGAGVRWELASGRAARRR
jgi:hypothetical protein